MAKLGISTGTTPNDNTGDSLINGAVKINQNFNEIYSYLGAGSTNILSAPIWGKNNVGINTLLNVGIGTTTPTSKLTVFGDSYVTGVITASSFDGAISFANYSNTSGVATNATNADVANQVSVSEVTTGSYYLTLSSGTGDNNIYIDQNLIYDAATNQLTAELTADTSQYADTSGVSTSVIGGIVSVTQISSSGISTLGNTVVGGATTELVVNGDARITGVLSVGQGTVTIDGNSNTITASTIVATSGLIDNIVGYASESYVNNAIVGLASEGYVDNGLLLKANLSGSVFSGIVTATSFYGSAQGLTNIPAGQLTGALPAIDGSSLINVIGSGSGVIILDDGLTVGTAGTINFGNNLSVSPISAGVVTVTGSEPGENYWSQSSLGIHTLSNVGLGTTNLTNTLTVNGSGTLTSQLYVTGVSTLGTLSVFSGIATASSGIVTYYGDVSNAVDGRWILGANGTSDYTFTGVGFPEATNDPELYLSRGKIYEFVNKSGGSHPFTILTEKNGSLYFNGVFNNAASDGIIRFEVPFNAPNKLYYQCANHEEMGGIINITPRIEPSVGSRATLTGTTGTIGSGSTSNISFSGFNTYSLLKVGISSAAWVVLYTDENSRTLDESRSYLTDPTPGSGIIAEVRTTTTGISTFIMSPAVIGWNNDSQPSGTIYAKVTNNEASTSTGITVSLTVVKLED